MSFTTINAPDAPTQVSFSSTPVFGSSAIWPEVRIMLPDLMPCEYEPSALGASGALIGGAFLNLPARSPRPLGEKFYQFSRSGTGRYASETFFGHWKEFLPCHSLLKLFAQRSWRSCGQIQERPTEGLLRQLSAHAGVVDTLHGVSKILPFQERMQLTASLRFAGHSLTDCSLVPQARILAVCRDCRS